MCQARISSAQPTASDERAADARHERAQARRRDEHRGQRERERGGRVAARPRRGADVDAPDLVVGVGEQRLEHLGGERRERHHGDDRQRHPRALAGERDAPRARRPTG